MPVLITSLSLITGPSLAVVAGSNSASFFPLDLEKPPCDALWRSFISLERAPAVFAWLSLLNNHHVNFLYMGENRRRIPKDDAW